MIGKESIANVEFSLKWKSSAALHREVLFKKINFWRDIMPGDLYTRFMGSSEGDSFDASFRGGEFVPMYNHHGEIKLRRAQLNESRASLRFGRFYPKGMIKGIPGVFPENVEPFRCTRIEDEIIHADFNHPMAGRDVRIEVKILDVNPMANSLGGECSDLSEVLTSGPGMQARWREKPTSFVSSEDEFKRESEGDDADFYDKPRFVIHTDSLAASIVSKIYSRYLKSEHDVLDLMSSWRSHLPEDISPSSVTGLGMNMEEMKDNPALTDRIVHDLNKNPRLPFSDKSFDLVICAMSVEYLTHPMEVFEEVARVLRQGGRFVVTFSNRWFPPKSIRIWSELHEFERMGYVLDIFLNTGKYEALETFSSRGFPRPYDDKYFPSFRFSDPVYCVTGIKMNL